METIKVNVSAREYATFLRTTLKILEKMVDNNSQTVVLDGHEFTRDEIIKQASDRCRDFESNIQSN